MTPPQSTQDPCREALAAAIAALSWHYDKGYAGEATDFPRQRDANALRLLRAAERALAQEPANPPGSLDGSQEPATSTEQDELDQSVSDAWERFNKKNRELRLRAAMRRMDELGPLPGMISSFETQMGVSWTDAEWKQETSLWAMAWRAAFSAAPQPPAASPPAQKHLGDSVGADGKRPAASGDGISERASDTTGGRHE